MSQRTLEAHYRPNWNLAQAHGFPCYNCGFTETPGTGSFQSHQQQLVWKVLERANMTGGAAVLDVGCGIGGPANWIAERYPDARVIGLDYCHPSIRAAQASRNGAADRIEFLQADAHELPIASDSMDVVFNLESALHYADKNTFFRECARVLRPGGTLCLADITAPNTRLFAPLRLINWIPFQFNSNLRLWSAGDYRQALPAAGLEVLHSEDITRPVCDALNDGLDQIRLRGWKGARGFRARFFYLTMLQRLFQSGRLHYNLFAARRPKPR